MEMRIEVWGGDTPGTVLNLGTSSVSLSREALSELRISFGLSITQLLFFAGCVSIWGEITYL